MHDLYQHAAVAIEALSWSDPHLQTQLATVSDTIQLDHFVISLQPEASLRAWYDSKGPHITISMLAGLLLQQQSHSSLLWVTAHELDHGIAQHTVERISWLNVHSSTIWSMPAMARLGPLRSIAAGIIPMCIVRKAFLKLWLSQQHEHEADIIGAAISKAAACSTNDVVCALARLHTSNLIEEVALRQNQGQDWAPQELALHKLQHLMPGISLCARFDDSWRMQQVITTVCNQLSSAMWHVQLKACMQVLSLWTGVTRWLVYVYMPRVTVTSCCSSHPHLSAGLINNRSSRLLAAFSCAAKPAEDELERLQDYQQNPEWEKFVALRAQDKASADATRHLQACTKSEHVHTCHVLW